MRRCGRFGAGLAALAAAAVRSDMMMCLAHRGHACVRVHFSSLNSHGSAALEGQHCYRKPQEQSEERTHHASIVPQIESMHQELALRRLLIWGFRRVRIPVHANAPSRGAETWGAPAACAEVAGSKLC